jgi:hypothetical protein
VYFVIVIALGIRAYLAWLKLSRLYHLAHLREDADSAARARAANLYPYVFGPFVYPADSPDDELVASARRLWLVRLAQSLLFATVGFIVLVIFGVLSQAR